MREISDRIPSRFLGNERTIWIHPPESGVSARALTVFLDGELYRDRVDARAVLRRLQGRIAPSWFVFVSSHSVEARWRECPCHRPFARFVTEELFPWLEERHIRRDAIRRRVIVGLSYTGLAAAYVAKQSPGRFQAVISQSGSFWWNAGALAARYRRLRTPLSTQFYLDVGTMETQRGVQRRPDVLQEMSQVEGVRQFRDVLVSRGHRVKYVEYEGGHDFAAWKKTLPDALVWALPPRAKRAA